MFISKKTSSQVSTKTKKIRNETWSKKICASTETKEIVSLLFWSFHLITFFLNRLGLGGDFRSTKVKKKLRFCPKEEKSQWPLLLLVLLSLGKYRRCFAKDHSMVLHKSSVWNVRILTLPRETIFQRSKGRMSRAQAISWAWVFPRQAWSFENNPRA